MQIKFYFSEMFAFDRLHDKKGLIDHTSVTTSKNVLCTDMILSCADPESLKVLSGQRVSNFDNVFFSSSFFS